MYAIAKHGVVLIERPGAMGSGSIVDPGHRIITNSHVVGDNAVVMVTLFDGRKFEGRVARRDPTIDLALIELDGSIAGLTSMAAGSLSEVEEGEEVFVIGHPMNLRWSVTRGIVSKIRGHDDPAMPDTIQIDAAVSPGNSGGPLLTGNGKLIGVVTMKLFARGAENLNFACPIERVVGFLNRR